MLGQPQLRMKILCPKCNQAVKLPDLEGHGVQTERCGKCGILVYATYEQRDGGRKVWDVHFEHPAAPKKAEPKSKDGRVALMLLLFTALAALILFSYWGDLNIIHINGP
jgi:Zn ribbon nucleic-acid-binding protein